jgi:flavin-dependent dehydrogenase
MTDDTSQITGHGSRITDVIVIGSGPAGCAAASSCVRAGLSVLIVTDASEQIKIAASTPVPLESIHPGVSSLLEKIGIAGAELDSSLAKYSGINAGNTYTPLGKDENGIWEGMHIRRDIFNAQLVHRVLDLGVSVMFNEKVESFILDNAGSNVIGIKTRSTDLHAKYIIDASGKKGIAGIKLNFKRKFYSPPLACWTGVSSIDETFSFDPYAAHFIPGKSGWSWLAPQPPNYYAWTRLSTTGEKSLLPPDELKDYSTIGKINFANMRWRLFRPLCTEGVVLCGDAAGILDPAAGQGIFNALMSGIQAGNTVIKCIKEPDLASFQLAYYDDWFVQQFETKTNQLRKYYEDNGINIFTR